MDDLRYSSEALSAKNKFYNVQYMVYVEGEDDLEFWGVILRSFFPFSFEVEDKGGSAELDVLISSLENEDLPYLVCRDSDYLRLQGRASSHPRVIYTKGYSIENSLYTVDSVWSLIRKLNKGRPKPIVEIEKWADLVQGGISEIVVCDFINSFFSLGEAVFPVNARALTEDNAMSLVSGVKVGRKIAELAGVVASCSAGFYGLLKVYFGSRDGFAWLRGHFLQTIVLHYVLDSLQSMGRKVSLSYDSLVCNMLTQLESDVVRRRHPHFTYYSERVVQAADSLSVSK